MLDIGIEDWPYQKTRIRADYLRVFDHLQAYYNQPRLHNIAPATIHYGLSPSSLMGLQHNAKGRVSGFNTPYVDASPKVSQSFDTMVGPATCSSEKLYTRWPPTWIKRFVGTSDAEPAGVPSHLVPHGTRLFVIYSTFPKKERWSRLHKTVEEIIMNTVRQECQPGFQDEMHYSLGSSKHQIWQFIYHDWYINPGFLTTVPVSSLKVDYGKCYWFNVEYILGYLQTHIYVLIRLQTTREAG